MSFYARWQGLWLQARARPAAWLELHPAPCPDSPATLGQVLVVTGTPFDLILVPRPAAAKDGLAFAAFATRVRGRGARGSWWASPSRRRPRLPISLAPTRIPAQVEGVRFIVQTIAAKKVAVLLDLDATLLESEHLPQTPCDWCGRQPRSVGRRQRLGEGRPS